MSWQKPTASIIWQAIDLFLAHAYDGAPPAAVRGRLETLRHAPQDDIVQSPVFEHDRARPDARLCLRLGNQSYPHMKLIIEPAPDGKHFLFKADTHDQHVQPPPKSRDGLLFAELMKQNRQIAGAIESAWEQAGLPTFKKFLKDDLERRAGAGK